MGDPSCDLWIIQAYSRCLPCLYVYAGGKELKISIVNRSRVGRFQLTITLR